MSREINSQQKPISCKIIDEVKKDFILISRPEGLKYFDKNSKFNNSSLIKILNQMIDEITLQEMVNKEITDDLKFLISDYIEGIDNWSNDPIPYTNHAEMLDDDFDFHTI